jgi:hypothetical protein
MDVDITLAVLRALQQHRVEYKVVGGVAINLHGLARATEDLDIFVLPTPSNVQRLRDALHSLFDDPSIDEITAEDLAGEYPAIQYEPPEGTFHIDILARLGEAFAYDDIEVELLVVEGIRIPTATPSMLYRMKRDTVRPQDHADAARLKAQFRLED